MWESSAPSTYIGILPKGNYKLDPGFFKSPCSRSGSISLRYGSVCGSFYDWPQIQKKTFIFNVLECWGSTTFISYSVSDPDPALSEFLISILFRIRILSRIRIRIQILDLNPQRDHGLQSWPETGQNLFFLNKMKGTAVLLGSGIARICNRIRDRGSTTRMIFSIEYKQFFVVVLGLKYLNSLMQIRYRDLNR